MKKKAKKHIFEKVFSKRKNVIIKLFMYKLLLCVAWKMKKTKKKMIERRAFKKRGVKIV